MRWKFWKVRMPALEYKNLLEVGKKQWKTSWRGMFQTLPQTAFFRGRVAPQEVISNLGKNKYVPRTGNSECGKPASSGWLVATGRCRQVPKVSAQVPSAHPALQGCWRGCGTLQAAPHTKGELGVLPDSSPAPRGLILHTFKITAMIWGQTLV